MHRPEGSSGPSQPNAHPPRTPVLVDSLHRGLFIQFPPAEGGGIAALAAELRQRGASELRSHAYDSLFLTGADVPAAAAVLGLVREHLRLGRDCEQTVELHQVPPPEGFRQLAEAGANRLSLALPAPAGAAGYAAWLEAGSRASSLASLNGLANLDLRLPLDPAAADFEGWEPFMASACTRMAPHLSLHAGRPMPPSVYERAYYRLADLLSERGYVPYEPLHAAWPGYACRYLQTCLSGAPYDGLGPGAAGYDGAAHRYRLTADPAAYREAALAGRAIPAEGEHLSPDEQAVELFLTRLRLLHGLPRDALRGRMSAPAAEASLQDLISSYLGRGYLLEVDGRLQLTRLGRCWADQLAEAVLAWAAEWKSC